MDRVRIMEWIRVRAKCGAPECWLGLRSNDAERMRRKREREIENEALCYVCGLQCFCWVGGFWCLLGWDSAREHCFCVGTREKMRFCFEDWRTKENN
ncbi:hypothetical protein VNO77_37340 [Canavalia gladiata]|uniref:Uncharacterized protein n=1 Tax=Canavalia gladiata TaxID=3824 RepID=A0AAN9K849_CANGL